MPNATPTRCEVPADPDLVESGARTRAPAATCSPVPAFLKRYGIWVIDASFLLITWSDHVWGIVENPWGSGVLLLLTTAVIVSGAFARRTLLPLPVLPRRPGGQLRPHRDGRATG